MQKWHPIKSVRPRRRAAKYLASAIAFVLSGAAADAHAGLPRPDCNCDLARRPWISQSFGKCYFHACDGSLSCWSRSWYLGLGKWLNETGLRTKAEVNIRICNAVGLTDGQSKSTTAAQMVTLLSRYGLLTRSDEQAPSDSSPADTAAEAPTTSEDDLLLLTPTDDANPADFNALELEPLDPLPDPPS